MARPLTADEKLRYPWASRITDFVPVGRTRRLGVLLAVGGLVVLAVGWGGIYITVNNVHAGVSITGGIAGRIVLAVSGSLMGAGLVIGLVTGVSALMRSAKTPLVWSIFATVPGAVAIVVFLIRAF